MTIKFSKRSKLAKRIKKNVHFRSSPRPPPPSSSPPFSTIKFLQTFISFCFVLGHSFSCQKGGYEYLLTKTEKGFDPLLARNLTRQKVRFVRSYRRRVYTHTQERLVRCALKCALPSQSQLGDFFLCPGAKEDMKGGKAGGGERGGSVQGGGIFFTRGKTVLRKRGERRMRYRTTVSVSSQFQAFPFLIRQHITCTSPSRPFDRARTSSSLSLSFRRTAAHLEKERLACPCSPPRPVPIIFALPSLLRPDISTAQELEQSSETSETKKENFPRLFIGSSPLHHPNLGARYNTPPV